VRRFQTEARAAAGLDHPNIVPVYEVGEHVGQHYFTMGFIEGDDLSDYARREKLSPQRIASLVQQIASAVQYAHSKGVIHRDLKPSNVLVDSSGTPRVTDFGLAKKLDDQSDLTRSGEVLGTPGYMAPEQAAGHGGRVSTAADIYALGAILYFCLTRRPPFLASSPVETLVLILESEPVPPRKLNPAVPRSLERICLRCLAREPEDRYATAQEVADDLDRFLQGQPILAEAPSLVDRVRSFSRRFPVFTVHLAAIGFALLISQIRFATVSERVLSDHLRVTGLLLGWLAFCGGVQVASRFAKREFWAETVWLCSDAVVFSSLLYLLTTSTNDPIMLMIGFPMLIVASGLFFRVRIVLIVTAVVVLSFIGYQLATAHLPRFIHYQVTFGVILVLIGACVMHQIRRVRLLTQYFENKRT
jgi:serine/threonine-protein kinase